MSTRTPSLWKGERLTLERALPLPLFPDLAEQIPPEFPPPPEPPQGTKVMVSLSGGKDSLACLLEALEVYGREKVIAHHQIILEDWPGTVEYNQAVCKRLGVPLFLAQGSYYGYVCTACDHHYLSSQQQPWCRSCGHREATFLTMVDSVLDLVEWRRMWPSLAVRFCTSYFKRDVFNTWARRNTDLLGSSPVLILGERWRESRGRAKLPYLRSRSQMKHITEYRPILHRRRLEVFRKAHAYGIEQHYCYEAQGLTKEAMLTEDVEGGPRMSCVMCFLKTPEQLLASYHTAQGRPIIERGLQIEQAIGHTLTRDRSLATLTLGGEK
jgi:3'-phosphoadenosine 5'-phosphosulfate sulfotransferase (PAPS reductase)/FAD synthetase